jgi:hypothetical protein
MDFRCLESSAPFLSCQYVDYVASNDTMTDELQKIWKEAIVAWSRQ